MHQTAAAFADRVREAYGLDPTIQEFPEGTKTAADAADAIGCSVAQIVKSLVFVADSDAIVVLTAGTNRVDTKALAAELGVGAVRTADPEEVKAATGWSIGGVPPFGYDDPVATYLDESLLTHDQIWAAAGTPEAVFRLDPADLQAIADPTPISSVDPV